MSENERKNDPWKALPPFELEDVRPCDLVVCRECHAVRHVGELALEKRSPGLFEDDVEGVFCPGCNQLLFGAKAWLDHRVKQELWDNRKAEEEGERNQRSDPLGRRAAEAAADQGGRADEGRTARKRAKVAA